MVWMITSFLLGIALGGCIYQLSRIKKEKQRLQIRYDNQEKQLKEIHDQMLAIQQEVYVILLYASLIKEEAKTDSMRKKQQVIEEAAQKILQKKKEGMEHDNNCSG